jgi:membrane protein implicated in regulation of membrane protease activity
MNADNVTTILTGIASSLIVVILIYFILPLLKIVGIKGITEFEESNKSFRTRIISRASKKQSSHMGDLSVIAIIIVTLTFGIILVITENIDLSTGLLKGDLTSKVFGFSTMTIVFIVLGFRFLLREYISQKIKAFENNLTILSAHLTDKKIAELKSEWVQMKTEDDYKNLCAKSEKLIETHQSKNEDGPSNLKTADEEVLLEESV